MVPTAEERIALRALLSHDPRAAEYIRCRDQLAAERRAAGQRRWERTVASVQLAAFVSLLTLPVTLTVFSCLFLGECL